jgi:PhoD-like phosphatase
VTRPPEIAGSSPQLVLGPLLRYAGSESATIWVEVDRACQVEVLGHRAATFQVEGHHFALVLIDDLEPGTEVPYEVFLDGVTVWPLDDGRPPSTIRTRNGERRLRLLFGSCRVGSPPPESTAAPWADTLERTGIDALWTYSRQLQRGDADCPDGMLLLGDQVYADEVSPETAAFIQSRRDTSQEPGVEVADFEEYTRLYRESWSDPDIRWLLSTVPSVMVFDDHDVVDDWNISETWLEEKRREPWWDERITGALMSYWVYQHIGNLSPPELAEEEMLHLVQTDEDAGDRLRAFARRCDRETDSCRWSFYRDFGDSRVLVLDSRAARVLGAGRREMIDEAEWRWIVEKTRGRFDHLVVASTLPVFMAPGIHHLEAWNEAVCAGAWGRRWARWGEWLRRAVDLEHWPAFNASFTRFVDLMREIAEGAPDTPAPASIVILGGDVHNVYVAEVDLGLDEPGAARIHQIVCSPFRNPLPARERRTVKLIGSRASAAVFAWLARKAGVAPPTASWRFLRRPTFHNAFGELSLDGRAASVTIRRSAWLGEDAAELMHLHTTVLADSTESPHQTEPEERTTHVAYR